jgi:hypothetical protein
LTDDSNRGACKIKRRDEVPFIAEIALLILLLVVAGAALVGIIALGALVVSQIIGRSKKKEDGPKTTPDEQ